MSIRQMRVLLVEDNPHDVELVAEAFSNLPNTRCELRNAHLLADALAALKQEPFDVVLLDLDLPDSSGVDSFIRVNEAVPQLPVLVLASQDGDSMAEAAIAEGALDYLSKKKLQAPELARAVRYATERTRLQRELAEARVRTHHENEIRNVERISAAAGTMITASFYSGGALRETAADEYASVVQRYAKVLDQAIEDRVHGANHVGGKILHDLATELGILMARPRDVIDIHTDALKVRSQNVPWQKAQAYLEEGRLTVLELMGNLAAHYRNLLGTTGRMESAHE